MRTPARWTTSRARLRRSLMLSLPLRTTRNHPDQLSRCRNGLLAEGVGTPSPGVRPDSVPGVRPAVGLRANPTVVCGFGNGVEHGRMLYRPTEVLTRACLKESQ